MAIWQVFTRILPTGVLGFGALGHASEQVVDHGGVSHTRGGGPLGGVLLAHQLAHGVVAQAVLLISTLLIQMPCSSSDHAGIWTRVDSPVFDNVINFANAKYQETTIRSTNDKLFV